MKRFWLRCKTFEGLFSSEIGIEGKTSAGRPFNLFVDKTLTKKGKRQGEVLVKVYGHKRPDGNYGIILPNDPYETSRCTTVSADCIAGEAGEEQ